jgi:hypothetical protein
MSTGGSFYDSEAQVEETRLHDQQVADADAQAFAYPASPTADPLQQAAGKAVDQAKQSASAVADQARQVAQSQASTQKDRAVNSLSAAGQAVSQVGQQLRQSNQEPIAQVADTVAGGISQAADYLRQRDIQHLMRDVEDLARRQPILFLGGAFLLGALGARFLKSTASAVPGGGGASQPSGTRAGQGFSRMPPLGTQGDQRWSGTNTGERNLGGSPVSGTTPNGMSTGEVNTPWTTPN